MPTFNSRTLSSPMRHFDEIYSHHLHFFSIAKSVTGFCKLVLFVLVFTMGAFCPSPLHARYLHGHLSPLSLVATPQGQGVCNVITAVCNFNGTVKM